MYVYFVFSLLTRFYINFYFILYLKYKSLIQNKTCICLDIFSKESLLKQSDLKNIDLCTKIIRIFAKVIWVSAKLVRISAKVIRVPAKKVQVSAKSIRVGEIEGTLPTEKFRGHGYVVQCLHFVNIKAYCPATSHSLSLLWLFLKYFAVITIVYIFHSVVDSLSLIFGQDITMCVERIKLYFHLAWYFPGSLNDNFITRLTFMSFKVLHKLISY